MCVCLFVIIHTDIYVQCFLILLTSRGQSVRLYSLMDPWTMPCSVCQSSGAAVMPGTQQELNKYPWNNCIYVGYLSRSSVLLLKIILKTRYNPIV